MAEQATPKKQGGLLESLRNEKPQRVKVLILGGNKWKMDSGQHGTKIQFCELQGLQDENNMGWKATTASVQNTFARFEELGKFAAELPGFFEADIVTTPSTDGKTMKVDLSNFSLIASLAALA